jgi:triosephosphate isomerase (TIM)
VNPFRRPLIAGNWKMNAGGRESCTLARAVAERTRSGERVDVVVAPPFTAIAAVAHEIDDARGSIDVSEGFGVGVAAQNMHALTSGAFTGEVSASMLADSGATWVIIGHSERRALFGETDDGVAQKTKAALEAGLRPIVCVGETLKERDAGETLAVVERQTRAFMQHLVESPGTGVIAYEPVWAIGTGKVASPEDAQEVHAKIRELLAELSEEVAELTRILYGGSVKGDNAEGLLGQEDIDGALVGGASLDAEGFGKIVDAAQKIAEQISEDGEEGGEQDESGPLSGARTASWSEEIVDDAAVANESGAADDASDASEEPQVAADAPASMDNTTDSVAPPPSIDDEADNDDADESDDDDDDDDDESDDDDDDDDDESDDDDDDDDDESDDDGEDADPPKPEPVVEAPPAQVKPGVVKRGPRKR